MGKVKGWLLFIFCVCTFLLGAYMGKILLCLGNACGIFAGLAYILEWDKPKCKEED